MEPVKVQIGSRWTYKGREYRVVSTAAVVKDPDSGNWYPAVIYEPVISGFAKAATPAPQQYVRQQSDFVAKFKES